MKQKTAKKTTWLFRFLANYLESKYLIFEDESQSDTPVNIITNMSKEEIALMLEQVRRHQKIGKTGTRTATKKYNGIVKSLKG